MRKVFLFDLDSTVTREEILPTIAEGIGKGEEMRVLTESAMMGEVTFEDSFRARIKILQDIPVSIVAKRVARIKLNDELVRFIRENKQDCYIVTGNLDAWITGLMEVIGVDEEHLLCSRVKVVDDKIDEIEYVMAKEEALGKFVDAMTIAVGDGNNDYELLKDADAGIAFGGVRNIAPRLFEVCDYAVYDEKKLCDLLEKMKEK